MGFAWLPRLCSSGTGHDPLGELAIAVVRMAITEAKYSAEARAWLEQVRADILEDAPPGLGEYLRNRTSPIFGGVLDVPLPSTAPARGGKGKKRLAQPAPAPGKASSGLRQARRGRRSMAALGG